VFKHVGAYDDIDSVYEAITAWLDEKNLTAKGEFIEEYLNEPQGADDALLRAENLRFRQVSRRRKRKGFL
jgi:effector-binding domain-containing protein